MAKLPSNKPAAADKGANEQIAELQKQLKAAEKAAADAEKARLAQENRIAEMEARLNAAPPQPPSAPAGEVTQPPKSLEDLMAEIQRQGGPKQAVAAEAADPNKEPEVITAKPTRKQMLEELARTYGTTPQEVEKMLSIDGGIKTRPGADPIPQADLPLPEGTILVPVTLKNDYWAGKSVGDQWPSPPDENGNGGDNRFPAGSIIKLPGAEARRLINEGKAQRADPLPDEV